MYHDNPIAKKELKERAERRKLIRQGGMSRRDLVAINKHSVGSLSKEEKEKQIQEQATAERDKQLLAHRRRAQKEMKLEMKARAAGMKLIKKDAMAEDRLFRKMFMQQKSEQRQVKWIVATESAARYGKLARRAMQISLTRMERETKEFGQKQIQSFYSNLVETREEDKKRMAAKVILRYVLKHQRKKLFWRRRAASLPVWKFLLITSTVHRLRTYLKRSSVRGKAIIIQRWWRRQMEVITAQRQAYVNLWKKHEGSVLQDSRKGHIKRDSIRSRPGSPLRRSSIAPVDLSPRGTGLAARRNRLSNLSINTRLSVTGNGNLLSGGAISPRSPFTPSSARRRPKGGIVSLEELMEDNQGLKHRIPKARRNGRIAMEVRRRRVQRHIACRDWLKLIRGWIYENSLFIEYAYARSALGKRLAASSGAMKEGDDEKKSKKERVRERVIPDVGTDPDGGSGSKSGSGKSVISSLSIKQIISICDVDASVPQPPPRPHIRIIPTGVEMQKMIQATDSSLILDALPATSPRSAGPVVEPLSTGATASPHTHSLSNMKKKEKTEVPLLRKISNNSDSPRLAIGTHESKRGALMPSKRRMNPTLNLSKLDVGENQRRSSSSSLLSATSGSPSTTTTVRRVSGRTLQIQTTQRRGSEKGSRSSFGTISKNGSITMPLSPRCESMSPTGVPSPRMSGSFNANTSLLSARRSIKVLRVGSNVEGSSFNSGLVSSGTVASPR